MTLSRVILRIPRLNYKALGSTHMSFQVQHCSGEFGSGAGRGGGSGGSIRDAGGAFGKMEAAREEEYFHKLQRLQLKNLNKTIIDEIEFHEKQIQHHKDMIERHKKRKTEIDHEEMNLGK